MILRILLLSFSLIVSDITFAQNYGNLIRIPVSPNSSSLGEYGNTPISLASGTPNVNVQLYEIKGKTLVLPISLSYRSSGIKVEEISSNIGAGWSLNAGGNISRAAMGLPEEGVGANGIIPRRPQDLVNATPYEIATLHQDGLLDPQPDIFFYSFLNYSGKFVFDNQGKAIVAPDGDFKIDYPFGTAQGIILTDADGVRYFFSIAEVSGFQEGGPRAISSWYLTKIESADKKEIITFDYELESYTYLNTPRETRMESGSASERTVQDWSSPNVWSEVDGLRLKRIDTNFGFRVEFEAGTTRLDINAKPISGIEIFYLNERIKAFDFDQKFLMTNTPAPGFPGYLSYTNYRLFLESLSIKDKDLKIIGSYEFNYYGRENGKDLLPHRVSFSVDHWGYYNGATNTTLLPAIDDLLIPYDEAQSTVLRDIPGADREPRFPEMQYGTLESITYPTGGRTKFIFEPHEYYDEIIGGLRIKEIQDFDHTGKPLRTKKFEYESPSIVGRPNYSPDMFVYFYNGSYHITEHPGCEMNDPDKTSYNCDRRYRIIGSGSLSGLGATNGYHISYGTVRELELGNGYKQYKFTTDDDFHDHYYGGDPISIQYKVVDFSNFQPNEVKIIGNVWSNGGWPYAPKTDWSWKRGLLLKEEVFREGESTAFMTTTKTYNFSTTASVYGAVIDGGYFVYHHPMVFKTDFNPLPTGILIYGLHKIDLGYSVVSNEISVMNGITRSISTEYLGTLPAKTSENVNGKLQESLKYYAHSPEFAGSSQFGSDLLRNANILATPIRLQTKTGKLETYRQESQFGLISGSPKLIRQIEYPTGGAGSTGIDVTYDAEFNLVSLKRDNDSNTSYLWDYNDLYITAHVSNCTSNVFSYASFEAENKGGWDYVENLNTLSYITGKRSLNISSGLHRTGLNTGSTYRLSFWYKGGTISKNITPISGTEKNFTSPTTGWVYWEAEFTGVASLSLTKGEGSEVLIDEVRLCPSNSQMTTYTYAPGIGLTSITDTNNVITYYRYDDFGRLSTIADANGNIVKQFDYSYREK